MGFVDSFFNPFRNVYRKESNKHPHARTLRGGLLRKVKDTFEVLAGEFEGEENDKHIGLFDYATLWIPYAIEGIFFWCRKTTENYKIYGEVTDRKKPSFFKFVLANVLYYPFFALHVVCNVILCNLLRKPFAALITLLASFIFIPAEIFSWVVDKIYSRKEKIYQLNVHYVEKKGQAIIVEKEKLPNERMTSIKMLGALLTESAEDLDSIQVEYQHALTQDMLKDAMIIDSTQKDNTQKDNTQKDNTQKDNTQKDNTVLFFDSMTSEFRARTQLLGKQNEKAKKFLFIFKEGIVLVDSGESSSSIQRFIMNASQYSKLSQATDITVRFSISPEKYCSSQLIFFRKNNADIEHIAYLQTDQKSLKDNHEPIQALLELNVGEMSLNFDKDADDNFKFEFQEETSLPFTITN